MTRARCESWGANLRREKPKWLQGRARTVFVLMMTESKPTSKLFFQTAHESTDATSKTNDPRTCVTTRGLRRSGAASVSSVETPFRIQLC
jgi:hypothetical protein